MAKVLKKCKHLHPKDCTDSWIVRWWENGAQHEKSFRLNYQAARDFSKTVEAGKRQGSKTYGNPAPPMTFGTYVETIWLPALKLRRTAGTYRIRESSLRIHVLPAFGDRLLTDVATDREGVTAWLATLSPGTRPTVLCALSAVLTEAQKAGRVHESRLAGIELLAASGAVTDFYSPSHAELEKMAVTMGDLGLAIWLMRATGARPGEVLAVRREAFSNGRLRLTEQIQQPGRTVLPHLKARKEGEFRDVPVPGYVQALIQELPAGYLFPDVTYNGFREAFDRGRTAAGIPAGADFTPHSLRHVFATTALSRGVPLVDVSRWLGHKNVQVTYQIYSHFLPDSWDSARAVLDEEFSSWSAA